MGIVPNADGMFTMRMDEQVETPKTMCMTEEHRRPFVLRPAKDEDRLYLDAFCFSERMDSLDDLSGVTVAVDVDDDPIGFIQIAIGSNGIAHVYPIVVNPIWRGQNVGSALISDALSKHGELRLVSRGSSVGFYKKLGFEECDWSLIDDECTEGCADCPTKDECSPLPMLLRK